MAAFAFLMVGLLVICDQLTKFMVVDLIKPYGDVTVINNFLDFTYLENRGAAFGMLQNQKLLFIIVTVFIVAVFIYILMNYEIKSKLFYISMILIVAGGLGNFIDRIFLGYVVDFIQVSFFPPVFNFADCCVTVGAFLLPVSVLFVKELAVKKSKVK